MKQLRQPSLLVLLAFAALSIVVLFLYPAAQFERALAGKVPVVLRVLVSEAGSGSKYHWSTVDVVRVIKNSSGEKIPNSMAIAATSWGRGLPRGECTVYLVLYNDASPGDGWKLYEPDSSTPGYSHSGAG